jgi:hypothetical protein
LTGKTSDSLKKLLTESILYEDKGLLVINNPSGLAVHGGSGIEVGVIEALREMFNTPVELVHRIDRATSGVLLIAKKRSVLKDLHTQLVQHQMEKRYTALVKGTWSKKRHTIDAPLYQNSRCTVVDVKGKEALSHFQPGVLNISLSAAITPTSIPLPPCTAKPLGLLITNSPLSSYKILSVNNFLRLSEVLPDLGSATRIGGIRTTSSICNL